MSKTVLHWSYRDYRNVPIDLFLYENLEEVYLKENFITQIPKWLLNLTNLKFIHLSGNALEELPDDIYYLENLEFLDVSNNKITSLPHTIGEMKSLQRLNVSGNKLTEIPKGIGRLKKLEVLDICANQLTSLPMEMSECSHLNELSMSDNTQLTYIPERIANMQSLQFLAAERCGLLYLPAALAKFVNRVNIFQNPSITHIPMIYETFFASFYDAIQTGMPRNIEHPHFFFVREKANNTKLLLPFGTLEVFHVPSVENRITLYDDCLHSLNYLNFFLPLYKNEILLNSLPTKYMGDHIKNGPIARCTHRNCFNPLYTSYYFMPVKRRNSTSKTIFSCNFCSMYCANLWSKENIKKYYSIEWELCDADD
ncbi:leucine-rich repeat-containing protein 28 [Episyrphus balteatus]|uniref:leucine-rich repeat-containing protein 28 n=1 Tax=Episyrphus balteatus TaxID=286459 RepID=UPI002486606C|nr:leucine-rich repeat-containing protein 28 [Episyrphus balteatus]